MNVSLIISVCIVVVTAAIAALIIYTIVILSDVRKMLRPVSKMLNEFHGEFRPLLNDLSGITGSINSFLARFDRISGFFFGKIDMMAQGTDAASSYFQKFMKNPKGEFDVISAGIKKGVEVLFRKKEG
jgi:uncharacterized protein YoxC